MFVCRKFVICALRTTRIWLLKSSAALKPIKFFNRFVSSHSFSLLFVLTLVSSGYSLHLEKTRAVTLREMEDRFRIL